MTNHEGGEQSESSLLMRQIGLRFYTQLHYYLEILQTHELIGMDNPPNGEDPLISAFDSTLGRCVSYTTTTGQDCSVISREGSPGKILFEINYRSPGKESGEGTWHHYLLDETGNILVAQESILDEEPTAYSQIKLNAEQLLYRIETEFAFAKQSE